MAVILHYLGKAGGRYYKTKFKTSSTNTIMRKVFLILLAVAAFTSCTKDYSNESGPKKTCGVIVRREGFTAFVLMADGSIIKVPMQTFVIGDKYCW
jgi:hypothetical protein